MKSFRTWILIAGILVAGLAINTAKAQDARADFCHNGSNIPVEQFHSYT